jgi:hypothetical protein
MSCGYLNPLIMGGKINQNIGIVELIQCKYSAIIYFAGLELLYKYFSFA